MELVTIAPKVERMSRKNAPPLGQYRWLKLDLEDDDVSKDDGTGEILLCVTEVCSNHIVVSRATVRGGTEGWRVRYRDLERRTRVEPEPEKVIQKRIADKQLELGAAVASMVDMVRNADLIQDPNAPQTLLPTTTRRDPKLAKKSLIALKEKEFPAAEKSIERITQEIVAFHQDLTLPMRAQTNRMKKAVAGVDKRLFALELYAGLGEDAVLVRNGKAPEPETPVVVRQMLRYMDEETLIAAEDGGMDFESLEDFDNWAAIQENLDRVASEPRCVVAFKIRRHKKDYGAPLSIAAAFAQVEKHYANMKTYLLIRNGEQVWRLATEIDFDPRLLPLSDDFTKPLTRGWGSSGGEPITPESLEYDEALEERMNKVYEYNRVMFLIQGLLDRSKVFKPHPPINLADEGHVARYFRAVFDEENCLPSSNPPSWENYRNAANAKIKKGSFVWCDVVEEDTTVYNRFGSWKKPHPSRTRPFICQVQSVSKDRTTVELRWSIGDRVSEERVIDKSRPFPNKPGWYYTKTIEHNYGEKFCRQTVKMNEVFAVEGYKLGDYKQFLCDAGHKGAYLEWSPPLLASERWMKKNNLPQKE